MYLSRIKNPLKLIFVSSIQNFAVLVLIISIAAIASAQMPNNREKGFVQPAPIAGLIPVNHPDISAIEREVRAQILASQTALLKLLGDNNAGSYSLAAEYGALGQIYQTYSFFEAAKECYLNAWSFAPREFKWVYLLGKTSEQQGDIEGAYNFYTKALKLKSDYLPLLINVGAIHLEQNRLDEADAEFKKALQLEPKSASALYYLGQVELAKKNYAIAAVYFEKVLQTVPAANRVNYSLGLAYRGLKETEKARVAMEKQGSVGVRAPDPIFDELLKLQIGVRLHLINGKTAFEAGMFQESANAYQRVLDVEPANVTALVNLGAVFVQLKKSEQAIDQFEKAVKIDPENLNARFNLGILLGFMNKTSEAIAHFQTILKAKPNDVESREHLAKQLVKFGKSDEALAEYSKIIEIDPEIEAAIIEKSKLLMSRKQYGEVKTLLENANAMFPTKGRTAELFALFLVSVPATELRDGEKALELAKAIYMTTGTAEHGILVSMAYAELGNCEEAATSHKVLIDRAKKSNDSELVRKLQEGLVKYENKKPCSLK